METNSLFKPYSKTDLPTLQVYVPQLFGQPDTVSVSEVRTGKGQVHKHCQILRVDNPAGPVTVCVNEDPWETQVSIRIGGLGYSCPDELVLRLRNPTVGQLVRAICNYVQRCLDAANDVEGGLWVA